MTPTILVLTAGAAVAVLVAVAAVVTGRGGQLARFEADHPPLELPTSRPITSADVGRVILPLAFWGYHVRAVDDVLRRLSQTIAERDARIAELERRVSGETRGAAPSERAPERTGTAGDTSPTAVDGGGDQQGEDAR
ncbi:hypothetical protein FHX37_2746 [Haloactinospora alba]|uniref:DivIVA domain-containing protein n=1 Tax=Haloactinospora alba TaxID=405555 RepID=A0A543NLT3_9ACTN|nr:hypothetical protein [Haloactinospora alba]TQN32764.1 hypothetical protein FHX37_2746 [Haloactinospora alba]